MDDLIYIANYYKLNYLVFSGSFSVNHKVFALSILKDRKYNILGTHWYAGDMDNMLNAMFNCFDHINAHDSLTYINIIKKEDRYDYRD